MSVISFIVGCHSVFFFAFFLTIDFHLKIIVTMFKIFQVSTSVCSCVHVAPYILILVTAVISIITNIFFISPAFTIHNDYMASGSKY